ncbi:sigma-70 family RNA polymerase sigma factor [Acetobacter suratthaniensis]|uniref:Sigma-70 family RNA polymerase sigma factor n=1 Tax=Acetobacter suratthaniensis TaxID=1502841 RepID=A0ABS3LIY1_9PROT|nr:sigma-70 family RNA polymerase sigma factor [Acetobacter suratthaniensis]MBO1327527.1 sigma-70 family RNA polymerase sigma factor [Acetobacter suratthaniensis]MCX2564858.1 sigma-70 family RNA polymerase sigma factor [Acetobacter suratthaniensis]
MSDTFHDQIVNILPKLRVQALALTRNRAMAEDLVQDAVCNALSAQASFIPGTNFGAWMHRILRNRFISDLRKKRETTDIDDTPQSLLAVGARHDDRLALQELDAALARLPDDQREALVLGVLEGMSYQELAEISGCAVGTAKSRVFRARRQLETWLTADSPATGRRENVKNMAGKGLPREKKCLSPVRNGLKHGTLEQSRTGAVAAGI